MAIIVPLSIAGAIGNYTQLVEYLRDLSDNDAYEQVKIDTAIRMAEAFINRELRARDIETTVTIAPVAGLFTLPLDCGEIIEIVRSDGYPLRGMTSSGLAEQYRDDSGPSVAFAVEGDQLRFAPSGADTMRMRYYRGIAPLTENSPSNWLLSRHPDLYVAGAMHYLAVRERDDSAAQLWISKASDILQSVQTEETRRKLTNLVPVGIQQVRGCRV